MRRGLGTVGLRAGLLASAFLLFANRADAAISLSSTSASLYPTQTGTTTTANLSGLPIPANGTGTLTFTGLPAGVVTSPSPVTYAKFPRVTNAAATFAFVAQAGAVSGTDTVTIADATFGGGSTTFALTIVEPQIRITVTNPSITLGASPVNVGLRLAPDPGFGFNARAGVPFVFAVDAGGPPANVTAGGPQTVPPPFVGPVTFTFRRTGPVTGGTYVVPVTATWTGTHGTTLSASANLTLAVPDISVAVGASTTVCNGGPPVASANVTLSPLGGYAGAPTMAVLSAPGGVAITPPGVPALPPPQTVTFQLAGTSATVGGQVFTAHVFDASVGVDRSFTVPFQVVEPLTPSVTPTAVSLQAGGASATFTASVPAPPPACAFNSGITVSLTGLPAGFDVPAPVVFPAPPFGPAPLVVSAGRSVAPGTYPATVHFAPTRGAAKDVPVSILVTAAPDFIVTAVPPSLTLTPGSTGKITFTVTPGGGFNAPVTMTIPSSPDVSASPAVYTFPPAGGSVVVTFTTSASASAATIPVTVSAAGGGSTTVSHTVSVTVVVQLPPADFNLRVSPTAPVVAAGRSTPLTFTLDALGSFKGTATVTAPQLPPGATLSPSPFVLSPGAPQPATLSLPRTTPPGTYTLVFRADEVPAPTARRPLLISKTISVPLTVQAAVGGFTVTVSPATVLASPEQAVAVRYEIHNLANAVLTITGDSFILRDRNGAVLGSVDEPFSLTVPPNGTTVVSNTVLVTGEQFAKAGTPPVVLADRTFRAAPDGTGFSDTATATVTVTAVNSLLATASATRISVVYPPTGTLVGRGNPLRAQGLVIGSGTGTLLVGWFFDGILVETATVPLQNGTPTAVSNAISLPTLVSGNHDISLAVLAPNTLSSPSVQIYVEEGEQTLRLVSPTAGAMLAPAFGAPTFAWIPVPGIARYGVGLRSRAPGAPWRWTYTTDTRWSPPASLWNSLPEGEYEWGVRGFTNTGRVYLDSQSGGASAPPTSEGSLEMADGWTVSSAQGVFSIGGSSAALQDLHGVASADATGVRFVWQEIPGAYYVHSLYEQAPAGLKRVRTEALTSPSLLLPSAALPRGGPLLWRVSAIDKDGHPLGGMAAAPVPAAGGAR